MQIADPLDALVRRDEIGGRLRFRFKAGRSYRARPFPMLQVPIDLIPLGDRPAVTADVAAPGQGVPWVFPGFLLILGQVHESEEWASVKIVGFAGGGFCCRGFYGRSYAPFGYPYGGFGYPYGGFGYPRYGWYPGFGVGFYSVGGHGGYPYGGYGYPISASASGYAPGTLAIDVTDGRSDELVWRGWAEGALFEPVSPERLADFIDEVVEKIMASVTDNATKAVGSLNISGLIS